MTPASPPVEDRKVRVVAAVVSDPEGRMLLCRRPAHKRHGDLWEFPGGKLEPGETPLQAAKRELGEELAVEVTGIGPLLYSVRDPGSEFVIEFHEVAISGIPQCIEHSAIAWLTAADLAKLPLAPSDLRFALQRRSTFVGLRD